MISPSGRAEACAREPEPDALPLARSFRLANYALLAGLLLLLFSPACTRKHSFQLADVTKTNQFTLVSRFGDLVSGVALHVTGELDASALLVLSGYSTQAISGAVDWTLNQPLRSSNCTLLYWPQQVSGGHLTVAYSFH